MMTGTRSLIRTAIVGTSALALLGLLLVSFGLVPTGFFDIACSAGGVVGTDLLCYGFVWNTVTTGAFIGVVGPLIGTYLVHREMALIGETLAHTAFAGVAFGFLFASSTGWSAPILVPALIAAILGALGVQYLAERTGSYGDVPIAIMLTGSFAIGTLIISYGGGFAFLDIESYLFGSLSTVTAASAQLMGVLSIVVIAVVAVTYKQLLFITFDEEAARVARLNVSAYNTLLIVLTAMVVVGAMQILGVILVAALLVVPVAAASQIAASFKQTLVLSVVIGEASVLTGLVLSYGYSLPPGATIVVVAIAVYLTAVAVSGRGFSSGSVH